MTGQGLLQIHHLRRDAAGAGQAAGQLYGSGLSR